MITDSQLAFIPIGANQSMVGGAGVSIPSIGIIDLLGQGVGTAPANIIGDPSSGVFGEDAGVGDVRPYVRIAIGTAFITGTGATLTVQFEGAVDSGAAGGYQPGAWTVMDQSPAFAAATLVANAVIQMDIPKLAPGQSPPRYLRLLFVVPAAEDFTAGSISSAVIALVPDNYSAANAARNYAVA